MSHSNQNHYSLRFEWGLQGIEALADAADVIVVVDTLSFCTAVDVAVSRAAIVYPYRFRDDTASAFAHKKGASLATHRTKVDLINPYSLSPASFVNVTAGERIVLPSPNGATLLVAAAERCSHVIAGCLRNASAVASAAANLGRSIAVIAAGEQWQGDHGGLRSAIEDLLGAGAILSAITGRTLSPEAEIAVAAFDAVRDDLPRVLHDCTSGRELIEMGFPDDIAIAAELNVSKTVPVLRDGALVGGVG
ncbi:MAG: 2-phosphosulfolactate phosphatase [bacterium]